MPSYHNAFLFLKKKGAFSPKVLNYEMSYKYKVELSCSFFIYRCHFFSVGFWVERSFCQQNWVFLWSYA